MAGTHRARMLKEPVTYLCHWLFFFTLHSITSIKSYPICPNRKAGVKITASSALAIGTGSSNLSE